MRRKTMATLLAAAICAGTISGCGTGSPQTGDTANQTTAAAKASQEETAAAQNAAETAAAEEEGNSPTDISVFLYGVCPDTAKLKEVQDAINAYSLEKIGVTVRLTNFDVSEYKDKLTMALAAKEDVDLAFMANYLGLETLRDGDALMDLTDLLPSYEGLYNTMPELVWESSEIQGRRYFIPNYKETFIGYSIVTPAALADTIKDKYGIDFQALEMNNADDFGVYTEYLDACLKEGVEMPYLPNLTSFVNLVQCGHPRYCVIPGTDTTTVLFDTETNQAIMALDSPAVQKYNDLMREWYEKGYTKEELLLSDFSATPYLQAGTYGITGWTTVPDNENECTKRYGVPVYLHEIGSALTGDSALGSGWSIPAYSEKSDAALRWLQLLNTDTDFADIFVYGIEGSDFNRTADGLIEQTEGTVWSNSPWKATNFMTPTLTVSDSPNKKELYVEMNAKAEPAPLLGFRADVSSLSAETAAISAKYSEYSKLIRYGMISEEDLKTAVEEIRACGFDTLLPEIQKQLDEFLANQ